MRSSDRFNSAIRQRLASGALGIGCLCLVFTSAVQAEPSDEARNLFREGRALSAQGYYQAACAKFEKSLRVEPGAGTEFNLAECMEKVGRSATARRLYLKVAQESQKSGLEKRAQLAFERADSLLTRVPRLQLQCIDGCPPGIEVYRDGVRLPEKTWTEPVEVDPGAYRVQVRKRDKTVWTTQAQISADPGVVIVTIPLQSSDGALQPESPASETNSNGKVARLGPTADYSRKTLARQPVEVAPTKTPNSFKSLTRALLYTGAGGLVVSGSLALWFNYKNGQAKDVCPMSEGCSSAEIARHDKWVSDAKLLRVGVYSGLALAGVSLSTAGILHYFGTRTKERELPGKIGFRVQSALLETGSSFALSAEGKW